MAADPHAGFIIASYLVTAATLAVLIGWIAVDHRRQKAHLADLEARGVTRRSSRRGEGAS